MAPNVKVLLTFAQGGYLLNVEPRNMQATEDGITGEVHFSQIQSGGFHAGYAKAQANAIDSNGFRPASKIVTVHIGSNLLQEVMTYE